jgi:hypothetical protein
MPGSKINLNLVQICNRGGYWIVGFSWASQSSQSKRVRVCTTSIIKTASEGVKSSHRAISSTVLLHPRQSSVSSSMRHVPTQGEGFVKSLVIVCVKPHVRAWGVTGLSTGGWGWVGFVLWYKCSWAGSAIHQGRKLPLDFRFDLTGSACALFLLLNLIGEHANRSAQLR